MCERCDKLERELLVLEAPLEVDEVALFDLDLGKLEKAAQLHRQLETLQDSHARERRLP
jgi:hypothetical protein